MVSSALAFGSRLVAYRDLLLDDLRSRGPIRLLTQLHGNTGDHLIWSGTEALLNAGGIPFERLPITDVPSCSFPDDCLVVPGSGALSRDWHEWLPALIVEASQRFHSVVILPSQYDASVAVVTDALARPNVFAYAREAASYAAARPFGRAAVALDPALYSPLLGPRIAAEEEAGGPARRLVALRTDKSSRLAELGYAANPAVNRDIGSTTRTLDEFVAAVRDADEVWTDRLHVAVTSAMCGIPLRYFDPHDRKISTYFAFAFRDTFAATARPCHLAELSDAHCIVPL